MIDLLPVLVQATVTTRLQLKQWFARYPAGMPWSVVSDYCIGDVNKGNDVFSFVVVAPHDKAENICEYIAGAAPNDLKNTSKVSLGLVQYLTCEVPVTFSLSFVMRREAALLRDYLSVEAMSALVAGAISFMDDRLSLYQDARDIDYHQSAIKRLKAFERDLGHKGVNAKLPCRDRASRERAATIGLQRTAGLADRIDAAASLAEHRIPTGTPPRDDRGTAHDHNRSSGPVGVTASDSEARPKCQQEGSSRFA